MSDAGGVGPNACEQTVERMLDGLAVIGRVFRSAFLGVGDCVRRVSYPLKEVVVNKYDQCMGRWTSHGTRTHRVSETVACFEAVEASEKSTVSSSDSSSEAS